MLLLIVRLAVLAIVLIPVARLFRVLLFPASFQRSEAQRTRALIEAAFGPARAHPRVEQIGRRLAEEAGVTARFRVIDDPIRNALTLPDGEILIWRGLLGATHRDDPMLAGILAHEIGHLRRDEFARTITLIAVLDALFGVFVRGFLRLIVSRLVKQVVVAAYRRRGEHGADAAAVDLMIAADYEPGGLIRALRATPDAPAGAAPLSTHPPHAERIKRIEELMRERGLDPHPAREPIEFPMWRVRRSVFPPDEEA